MHDKAMTTLAGSGAVEFWIVDLDSRTVTVHAKGSGMCVYRGDARVFSTIRIAAIKYV
jgi:hypothetical protein